MTAKELVAIEDGRCAADWRIGGICKRSKRALTTRIEARGDRYVSDLKPENAEVAEPSDQITVSQTAQRLLTEWNLALFADRQTDKTTFSGG